MTELLLLATLFVREPLELIELHDPTGTQIIYVNPSSISSLREPRTVNRQYFTQGAHCILVLTNGQFISASETCLAVRDILAGH